MTIPFCTATGPGPWGNVLRLLGAVIRLLEQPHAWSLAITNQTYTHRQENFRSSKFDMVSEGQVGRKQLFQSPESHRDITQSRGTSLPLAHRELTHTAAHLTVPAEKAKGDFVHFQGTANRTVEQSTTFRCPLPLHARSSWEQRVVVTHLTPGPGRVMPVRSRPSPWSLHSALQTN